MHVFNARLNFALSWSVALAATMSSPTASSISAESTSGNLTAQYKLYKFQGCLKNGQHNDKKAILDALAEAHTILGADGNYNIGDHWHSMNAVEFFGNPSLLKQNTGRNSLKRNLENAYSFTNGWKFSSHTTAIYCRDGSLPDQDDFQWSRACGSPAFPDPIVVAPNYHGKNKPALLS